MKKTNIIGLIAAFTFASAVMAVPVMALPAWSAAPQNTVAAAGITKDQALSIALKQAGVAKKSAQYISVHPDYDDGRQIFEVKFFVGATEYKYDIDAISGRIVDADIDMEEFDDWDD